MVYKTAEACDEAQKHRPHVIDSRHIDTKRAVPKEVRVWYSLPSAYTCNL